MNKCKTPYTLLSEMDSVKAICRLCLNTGDIQSSPSLYDGIVQAKITTIFNFPVSLHKSVIGSWVKTLSVFCFQIESCATLPSTLCAHCLFKIDDFHEFTQTVRQNQEQLKDREATLAQNAIKVEPMEAEEQPPGPEEHHDVKAFSVTVKSEDFINDVPVTVNQVQSTPPVQQEHDEARVVRVDTNRCIVQSHQDETVQFKIEFDDAEVPRETDSPVEKADKIEQEDRLIRQFFTLNCEVCSEPFDNFSRLKQHTTVVHDKKLIIRYAFHELLHTVLKLIISQEFQIIRLL